MASHLVKKDAGTGMQEAQHAGVGAGSRNSSMRCKNAGRGGHRGKKQVAFADEDTRKVDDTEACYP
jgi:hypothetical protein